jgi:hypothetical protein
LAPVSGNRWFDPISELGHFRQSAPASATSGLSPTTNFTRQIGHF